MQTAHLGTQELASGPHPHQTPHSRALRFGCSLSPSWASLRASRRGAPSCCQEARAELGRDSKSCPAHKVTTRCAVRNHRCWVSAGRKVYPKLHSKAPETSGHCLAHRLSMAPRCLRQTPNCPGPGLLSALHRAGHVTAGAPCGRKS